MDLLNGKLDELVAKAFAETADLDESQFLAAGEEVGDSGGEHTSLLRFLVTVRGEEASATQLRDDLMTMLVAGHETTAALLTWTLYELFHPSKRSAHHLARARAEADAVFERRAAEGRTGSTRGGRAASKRVVPSPRAVSPPAAPPRPVSPRGPRGAAATRLR